MRKRTAPILAIRRHLAVPNVVAVPGNPVRATPSTQVDDH